MRQFFALVTYVAIVVYLVVPSRGAVPFSQPLSNAYDYARAAQVEPMLWVRFVASVVLLVGTTSPFFLFRWWTVIPAILCGVLYIAIGYADAIYRG